MSEYEDDSNPSSQETFAEETMGLAGKFLILSSFLLIVLISTVSYQAYKLYEFDRLPVTTKLQKIWNRDMETLRKSGKLPKEFQSIKEVQYFTGDKYAKAWLPHISAPVELKKEGRYKLEILLVSWQERKKAGVMIQYDLIDASSGNLTKEFGRTFVLKGKGLKSKIESIKKWVSSFPLFSNKDEVLESDTES